MPVIGVIALEEANGIILPVVLVSYRKVQVQKLNPTPTNQCTNGMAWHPTQPACRNHSGFS